MLFPARTALDSHTVDEATAEKLGLPPVESFSGRTAGTTASPAVRRSSDSVDQLGFA
jgi:hypothetical protein